MEGSSHWAGAEFPLAGGKLRDTYPSSSTLDSDLGFYEAEFAVASTSGPCFRLLGPLGWHIQKSCAAVATTLSFSQRGSSVNPEPQVDYSLLEETRKRINQLVAQIARASESDLPPSEYYGQFLQHVLDAVAAPAGALWVRTPQGHLQLQYQIKLDIVGLDQTETSRQAHDELLRLAAHMAKPQMVPPHSGTGPNE